MKKLIGVFSLFLISQTIQGQSKIVKRAYESFISKEWADFEQKMTEFVVKTSNSDTTETLFMESLRAHPEAPTYNSKDYLSSITQLYKRLEKSTTKDQEKYCKIFKICLINSKVDIDNAIESYRSTIIQNKDTSWALDFLKYYKAYDKYDLVQNFLFSYYFEGIQKSPTLSDCENYLKRFPNSTFKGQILNIIDSISFNQMILANQISETEKYLNQFSQSPYKDSAISILSMQNWETIKGSKNINAYINYAQKFPKSRYLKICRESEIQLAWELIKDDQTIDYFTEFNQKYPGSNFEVIAKQKIQLLAFQAIKDSKEILNFEKYKNTFPESAYIPIVDSIIIHHYINEVDKVSSVPVLIGYKNIFQIKQLISYVDAKINRLLLLDSMITAHNDIIQKTYLRIIPKNVISNNTGVTIKGTKTKFWKSNPEPDIPVQFTYFSYFPRLNCHLINQSSMDQDEYLMYNEKTGKIQSLGGPLLGLFRIDTTVTVIVKQTDITGFKGIKIYEIQKNEMIEKFDLQDSLNGEYDIDNFGYNQDSLAFMCDIFRYYQEFDVNFNMGKIRLEKQYGNWNYKILKSNLHNGKLTDDRVIADLITNRKPIFLNNNVKDPSTYNERNCYRHIYTSERNRSLLPLFLSEDCAIYPIAEINSTNLSLENYNKLKDFDVIAVFEPFTGVDYSNVNKYIEMGKKMVFIKIANSLENGEVSALPAFLHRKNVILSGLYYTLFTRQYGSYNLNTKNYVSLLSENIKFPDEFTQKELIENWAVNYTDQLNSIADTLNETISNRLNYISYVHLDEYNMENQSFYVRNIQTSYGEEFNKLQNISLHLKRDSSDIFESVLNHDGEFNIDIQFPESDRDSYNDGINTNFTLKVNQESALKISRLLNAERNIYIEVKTVNPYEAIYQHGDNYLEMKECNEICPNGKCDGYKVKNCSVELIPYEYILSDSPDFRNAIKIYAQE